jgi:predicted DNA-binding antitoxin AbrB/MazE fold protein
MSQAIRAIYEDGHLRLLDPVELTEGAEVKITILSERAAIIAALGDLIVPAPVVADEDFDEEAAMRLIHEELRAGGYPSASEYIIQERREGP